MRERPPDGEPAVVGQADRVAATRPDSTRPEAPITRLETVNLLRWLRRQLAQPGPLRERLEAAVANDDPAEARRLLAHFSFGADQRRHLDALVSAWERELEIRPGPSGE